MNGQVHRQYNSGLYILRHNDILQFNWLKYYCPDFDCICTDVARYQGHLIDLVNKQFRQLGDFFFFFWVQNMSCVFQCTEKWHLHPYSLLHWNMWVRDYNPQLMRKQWIHMESKEWRYLNKRPQSYQKGWNESCM